MEKDWRDFAHLTEALSFGTGNVVYSAERFHMTVAQIVDDHDSNASIE